MWLIAGLFAFALLERLLSSTADAVEDSESNTNGLAEEDEDSDTQNNNDPGEKKLKKKKDVIKKNHSAPSSQLSLLNPFHGMSSKQVYTHNFLFTHILSIFEEITYIRCCLGDGLFESVGQRNW